MKTKILILFLVLLVPNGMSIALEINDSCFYLLGIQPIPGYEIHNPDSILIDTCSCSGIPWEKCPELYAKEWFLAIFPYGVFDLPKYPKDTTIFVTIEDMSSSFTVIKQKFIDLENNFGDFTIKKVAPNIIDSSITARGFFISFDEYCKIESVIDSMQIDNDYWHFSYNFRLLYQLSSKNDTPKIYKEDIGIYPIPASEEINLQIKSAEESNCKIIIYNTLGMEVKNININLNSGINGLNLNVSDFSSGVYFVVVNDGKEVRKQMFIKE